MLSFPASVVSVGIKWVSWTLALYLTSAGPRNGAPFPHQWRDIKKDQVGSVVYFALHRGNTWPIMWLSFPSKTIWIETKQGIYICTWHEYTDRGDGPCLNNVVLAEIRPHPAVGHPGRHCYPLFAWCNQTVNGILCSSSSI